MSDPVLPSRARVVVIGGGVIGSSVAYHLAAPGLDRRRPARARPADVRHDVARRRADGHLRLDLGDVDRVPQVHPRPLLPARGRDRPVDRLHAGRLHRDRDRGRPARGVPPRLRVQPLLRRRRARDLGRGGRASSSRSRGPTTSSPASTSPRTAGPTRSTSRWRSPRAPGSRARRSSRASRSPACTKAGGAVTGVTTPYGDIEASTSSTAPACGPASSASRPASTSRCRRPSTTTSSPRSSTGIDQVLPGARGPAQRTATSARRAAASWSASSRRCARPGRSRASRPTSSFLELPPDWDRMAPYLEAAMSRVPITIDVGIRKFFCGPESFTADLQPVVGEAPELRNYFVAAGLNSVGILTGGGMGRALAHWITTGSADVDITGFNIDRLHTYQRNPEYRATRTVESLGRVYACHFPDRSMETARGAKLSPIHHRLAARRRLLPRRQRLGEPGLVRTRGARGGPGRAQLGTSRLVPALGGRAPGGPQRRDPHGHVVHGEVPRAGHRRRRAAQLDLRERRRRRVRCHHLHPVAQRGGQARGRPHRHEARRREVLGGGVRHGASPRGDASEAALRGRTTRSSRTSPARTRRSTSRGRGRASCCSR